MSLCSCKHTSSKLQSLAVRGREGGVNSASRLGVNKVSLRRRCKQKNISFKVLGCVVFPVLVCFSFVYFMDQWILINLSAHPFMYSA